MKKVLLVTLVLLIAIPAAAQQQQQMSKEEMAAMEAYMKAATPGAPHDELAKMVGTWTTKVSYYPAPGAPAQVSDGLSENRMIMGGRYLEQRFNGSMMGAPFEGLGYTGYDNVSKQYWGTWVDSTSTGVMTSWGKTAADGSLAMEGSMYDAMTGKQMKVKEKIVMKSADEHVFEMWGPDKGGKNYKMMEIVYTRKK